MKKITFLFLCVSSICYSQLNFGLKTGYAVVDYKDDNGIEFFGLKNTIFYGALLEYKNNDIAGEFEMDYYTSKTDPKNFHFVNAEVQTLIPSLSFKYYPVDNFNIKIGAYLNSTSVDIEFNNSRFDNIEISDTGAVIGMEVVLWKGLFVDARMMLDVNGNDDLRTSNFMLGAAYKI